jgi:hypothetical protein
MFQWEVRMMQADAFYIPRRQQVTYTYMRAPSVVEHQNPGVNAGIYRYP